MAEKASTSDATTVGLQNSLTEAKQAEFAQKIAGAQLSMEQRKLQIALQAQKNQQEELKHRTMVDGAQIELQKQNLVQGDRRLELEQQGMEQRSADAAADRQNRVDVVTATFQNRIKETELAHKRAVELADQEFRRRQEEFDRRTEIGREDYQMQREDMLADEERRRKAEAEQEKAELEAREKSAQMMAALHSLKLDRTSTETEYNEAMGQAVGEMVSSISERENHIELYRPALSFVAEALDSNPVLTDLLTGSLEGNRSRFLEEAWRKGMIEVGEDGVPRLLMSPDGLDDVLDESLDDKSLRRRAGEALQGVPVMGPGGPLAGVAGRWLADTEDMPPEIRKAVDRGEGPVYERLVADVMITTALSGVRDTAPDVYEAFEMGIDLLQDMERGELSEEDFQKQLSDPQSPLFGTADDLASFLEMLENDLGEAADATRKTPTTGQSRRQRKQVREQAGHQTAIRDRVRSLRLRLNQPTLKELQRGYEIFEAHAGAADPTTIPNFDKLPEKVQDNLIKAHSQHLRRRELDDQERSIIESAPAEFWGTMRDERERAIGGAS